MAVTRANARPMTEASASGRGHRHPSAASRTALISAGPAPKALPSTGKTLMLSSWSNADLVRAAQDGDREALGVLILRHQGTMYSAACAVLGPGPDAEDAVQDAALTALRQIGSVREPAAIAFWLRTIVRNACLMQLRASRTARTVPVGDFTQLELPSNEPTPEETAERREADDRVWRAVQDLTEVSRIVVYLRYFSNTQSYEEIAEVCRVPVGTVRSRLNQAKRNLAPSLLGREYASASRKATRSPQRSRPAAAARIAA
jgi:RNA polymerase sigma factor (sigma-70 family)